MKKSEAMMEPLAQTNLQLYRQMLSRGHDHAAVTDVHRAYLFVARQTSGMLRGSGKPFVCHLVGSASALCACGQPGYVLSAALLHSMYQNRVPFGNGLDLDTRRRLLRERFGTDSEELVYATHVFEWDDLAQAVASPRKLDRTVALMRLCDALEDMLDEAMVLHGQPGETAEVWGTAAWRVEKWSGMEPTLVEAARTLGEDDLAVELERWMKANRNPSLPPSVKSGEYSSYDVAPE